MAGSTCSTPLGEKRLNIADHHPKYGTEHIQHKKQHININHQLDWIWLDHLQQGFTCFNHWKNNVVLTSNNPKSKLNDISSEEKMKHDSKIVGKG